MLRLIFSAALHCTILSEADHFQSSPQLAKALSGYQALHRRSTGYARQARLGSCLASVPRLAVLFGEMAMLQEHFEWLGLQGAPPRKIRRDGFNHQTGLLHEHSGFQALGLEGLGCEVRGCRNQWLLDVVVQMFKGF